MFVQLFGKYLIENKIFSPTILKQIIDKQKTVRVKLGTIAIAEGYMTEEQVTEINEIQKREDKRFGDVAIEMGLLTDEKLKTLLSKQGDAYMQFVELLTEMTGLSNRDIEEFLKAYKKDAGFSDAEMEALKSDDMDALMPLFIFSKKPYVIDIAGLILRNFVRFISADFYIEKVKHLKELPYSHLSVQELAGDHSVFIGIAAEEDSEAFLKIGNSFAHDEKTDVVVDTYDSVSEFINVTGGIFASELSKKGTDIDMEPPLSFKDQKAAGDFYVVPVYLEGKKVDIVISVDSEFTAGDTPVNTGAVIASIVVVSISSATPSAAFARMFAVAGATSTRSAQSASAICATFQCCTGAHISTVTGLPLISRKVSSVTNSVASFVMTTRTSAPALRRRLTTSTAL